MMCVCVIYKYTLHAINKKTTTSQANGLILQQQKQVKNINIVTTTIAVVYVKSLHV